jgi:hypothetical protein
MQADGAAPQSAPQPAPEPTPQPIPAGASEVTVGAAIAEIQSIYRDVAGKTEQEAARVLKLFEGREQQLLAKLRREHAAKLTDARVRELQAEIKLQQRIIFATGMACTCPGCEADEVDEWCATPAPRAAVHVRVCAPQVSQYPSWRVCGLSAQGTSPTGHHGGGFRRTDGSTCDGSCGGDSAREQ